MQKNYSFDCGATHIVGCVFVRLGCILSIVVIYSMWWWVFLQLLLDGKRQLSPSGLAFFANFFLKKRILVTRRKNAARPLLRASLFCSFSKKSFTLQFVVFASNPNYIDKKTGGKMQLGPSGLAILLIF